jgi:hypothetical protein
MGHPFTHGRHDASAFLTDPAGVYIELTEGLKAFDLPPSTPPSLK